jgi:hypothetical protein
VSFVGQLWRSFANLCSGQNAASPPIAGSLVYLKGARGIIQAEKWRADAMTGARRDRLVICEYALTAREFGRPLERLIEKYPAPQ